MGLTLALVGCWIAWSWHFNALLLTLGVISIIVTLVLSRRMSVALDVNPFLFVARLIAYLPWLFLQIAKANLDVARRILSPGLDISPRMIRVKAGQRGDFARVIYANSITLTPGTVSVDFDGDEITVHALTAEAAEELESGRMDRRVCRLEGRR